MYKDQKESLTSLLQYILYAIFGIMVLSFIAFLDYQGAFILWKSLDGQPKFKQIITANPLTIQAQASNNKYYSFRIENFCTTQSECNQWTEIKQTSNLNNEGNLLVERGVSCNEFKHPMFFRMPPGNVVECVRTEEFVIPEMRSIVYYALLNDGRILAWDFTDSFVRSRSIGATCLLVVAGGSLSGIIVLAFLKNRQKAN